MPILPVDLQAVIMRMENMSRMQHGQQEGMILAQALKGSELGEAAQVQSSRVNQVQQQPDRGNRVEDEQKKERGRRQRQQRSPAGRKKSDGEGFQEPDKGTHIDVTR
jgi:hypothetical protein